MKAQRKQIIKKKTRRGRNERVKDEKETKGRRDGGTKGRWDEGTKRRRDGGTKGRRDEETKGRRDEGTKGRRDRKTTRLSSCQHPEHFFQIAFLFLERKDSEIVIYCK